MSVRTHTGLPCRSSAWLPTSLPWDADPAPPVAYVPFGNMNNLAQTGTDWGTFVVRTKSPNPMALASILRQEVPRARSEFPSPISARRRNSCDRRPSVRGCSRCCLSSSLSSRYCLRALASTAYWITPWCSVGASWQFVCARCTERRHRPACHHRDILDALTRRGGRLGVWHWFRTLHCILALPSESHRLRC